MEETEQSPSAIEIHNLNPVTSKDLLVCYFESRRGANVDVIDITFDNVKNMHILWFANEKIVESTLNKTHKLDGKFLDVRQHLESKVLKCVITFDKMLITGLNKSSTKDSLKNFLEAKLGNTALIKGILLGEEGAALVTLTSPINHEQIRNACSDSTLDGHNISITHVPVSDCVIVSGFNEYIIVDTLELYFDNKKRCGADGVKDVKMDRTLGKCLIYFKDPNSAEEVCRRTHVVDGQTLCVLMHYEGFQQRCKSRCTKPSKRKWDRNVKAQTMRGNYVFKHHTNTSIGNNPDYGKEEEAKSDTACEAQVAVGMFRIPEPIIIQSIDHRKIEFIMKSPAEKASFEFLLLSYHARVKWPELTEMNCTLEIISTLAKHFKNCTSLSKTWTTTVSKQTETFFDMLCVNELSISQEIWDNVEKHLPSGNEHVIVRAIKKFRKVSIVGHKIEANEFTMLIEDIIENFKIVVNKRKCEGFEEIDVQEYQLYILNYSQFAVDMQSQYNDLAVTLDFKKFKVIFTGTTEKIVEAKVKMFEILGKIKCDLRGEFCDQFIQYLSIQEVDEFVRTQFYKKGAFGAWEFQKGNAIGMYSFSGHEAGVAFDMLLTSIVNEQLYISNSKCVALDSEQWLNEQKTIRRIHQKALIEIYIVNGLSDRNVSIYSISARAARSVHGEIKKFLSQYTPLSFPINPTKTWKEDENIKPTENTWKIEKYLQPTANTWTADRYIKPTAKRWKEGGYIKPTTRTWKKDKYIKPIAKTWLTRTGQSIYTLVGDITCLDVDVIVNSVNKNHQLKQGLARLMVDKGGDIIRRECNDYIRRNGTLEEGDVMWTSAGDLPCKWILHAVSPVWKNGRSNEFGNLYDCIWQSFGKAYRRECSSIAIPALSTGISGFPANRSTDTIVKAIHDYMKKNGHYTSIQQVYLCDINTDTIDHFESALDLYFPYTLLTDYQHDLFHSDI